ncbi:MAG: ATP synthase F1 subunit gamma [Sarcina sp.]
MPAGGLLALKNRVKSVKTTKKTTKAMSLISASKMKKARVKLQKNDFYLNNLKHIGTKIFRYADSPKNNILTQENGEDKKLYIILASDTGLCGGFNGNGANYLARKFGNDKKNVAVILSGKRARYYVNKHGFETIKEYQDPKNQITIKEAKNMVSDIVDLFLHKGYEEISLVYTKFFSAGKQRVVEERLLPFEVLETEEIIEDLDFDIEPGSDEIVADYIMRQLEAQLINAVYHSKASEHSARMMAMDNATTNASKMAVELEASYNRLRQSVITQEIAEIIGGLEASKSKKKKKK